MDCFVTELWMEMIKYYIVNKGSLQWLRKDSCHRLLCRENWANKKPLTATMGRAEWTCRNCSTVHWNPLTVVVAAVFGECLLKMITISILS